MKDLEISEIVHLAEKGELAEAAKILDGFFESVTPAEYGAAYVSLASAYLQLKYLNQESLISVLDTQLNILKRIDKQEKQDLENVELDQIRNQLKN